MSDYWVTVCQTDGPQIEGNPISCQNPTDHPGEHRWDAPDGTVQITWADNWTKKQRKVAVRDVWESDEEMAALDGEET